MTPSAPAVESHRPAKWVLGLDHGLHPIARAQELWRYRRLVWFFARETFQMLFKRTRLGWMWLVIRPVAPLVVGTVVYGGLMNVPSADGLPYFVMLQVGSLAWNCFDGPWMWGSRGLELNRHLVTKLYFPRMILPLSTMSPGLSDPAVGAGILTLTFIYYRLTAGVWYVDFSPRLLLIPLLVLATLILAFGLSLFTSNWQARARDVRFMISYTLGFWMYATPVIYPVSQLPQFVQRFVWLNPLAVLVQHFKMAILGGMAPPVWASLLTGAEIATVVMAGLWYFHKVERTMEDRF